MDGNVITVERTIGAPASAIFAVLSDPARHREFDGSGNVVGTPTATGAPMRAVGDTFSMRMRMGVPYRMLNTVVEYEQDRRIAWSPHLDVPVVGAMIGGRVWRYELEPVDGGTTVRESWDVSGETLRPLVKSGRMPSSTKANMSKSLERLEALLS